MSKKYGANDLSRGHLLVGGQVPVAGKHKAVGGNPHQPGFLPTGADPHKKVHKARRK